ncbi:MAG: trypsin-like peptidase domain-containing protein [Actinobacteria bacterium]|nr:trypsin-like peptidase domain-containing protein [Actinomycetota bacterium]
MTRNRNRIAAALCVAAVAGGGAGAGAVALTHGSSPASSTTVAVPAASVSNVAAGLTLTVGQIAKQSSPGIVEIDATSASASAGPFGGSQSSSAEGTGFVYDLKGDIVTNEHVISGSNAITVKFPDGTKYKATVVGSDTSSDVAVLHVAAPASKLTVLTLDDSSKVAVGDGVVAIGNPFGLDNTVTSGIVSALDREITAPDNTPIEGAIQTDAAINHGNSGGPLLDLEGKVIGITAQIQSDSGGNDGVGFAIPSNTVRTVVTQLISTGTAQHALLGVNVQTAATGVKVAAVSSGSGAADGGVKAGDVITDVGGTHVATAERLRAIIAAHQPGDTLTLTVNRDGASKTLKVTLGNRS